MLDTFRLAAAAGDTYDLLGDRLGTEGDRGAPHRAVVTAWHAAVQAVASGPVVLGDKEAHDKDIYYIYNEGHVLDLGLPRDGPGGRDRVVELKTYEGLVTKTARADTNTSFRGPTLGPTLKVGPGSQLGKVGFICNRWPPGRFPALPSVALAPPPPPVL